MRAGKPESAADAGFSLLDVPGSSAITRLSAVDTVRARILLAVEHRLLAPGSRLPKTEAIAAGLEVGTITARRALEGLVSDGILVRRRGRGGGTFVADAPPELRDEAVLAYRKDDSAIRRLIDQRSLMESAIMHAAALRATPGECDELEEYIERSAAARTWMEHHVPDSAFHRRCAEISDLPEVAEYLATYDALLKYFVPYPQEKLEEGRDHHRGIVAALRAHDPVEAVAITRAHVDALRAEMFMAL